MERLPYFKGELYIIALGGVLFVSGIASEPGAALFGLALVIGTGLYAWNKWQKMDSEARQRQERANRAIAQRKTASQRAPVPAASKSRGGARATVGNVSPDARRVAEALSALGQQSYRMISEDLGLEESAVVAAFGELHNAGLVERFPGGIYQLKGTRRRRPLPPTTRTVEQAPVSPDVDGAASIAVCPSCKAPLLGDESFCSDCGAVVEAGGVPENVPDEKVSAISAIADPVEVARVRDVPSDGSRESVGDVTRDMAEDSCSSCGAALGKGARFCRECGAAADVDRAQAIAPASLRDDVEMKDSNPEAVGVAETTVVLQSGPPDEERREEHVRRYTTSHLTCPFCEASFPTDAKFCRSCGHAIETMSQRSPVAEGHQLERQPVIGSQTGDYASPDGADGLESGTAMPATAADRGLCATCGAKWLHGARFCRECGQAIE